MMFAQNNLQYHPDMTPAEAARVWMRLNECTDNGRAAINYHDDKTMSVNYKETSHGIVIMMRDGTCLPVPYRYDGSTHNLLRN